MSIEKTLNTIIDKAYRVKYKQGGEMGKMLVKKAVVIGMAALFILISMSASVSSKEFILGALRLKMFLNKPVLASRIQLLNITISKVNDITPTKKRWTWETDSKW
ncbi:hypothetical protein B6U70_01475 [Euryarchaeota archaeon ex4484_162]|nr:MAG: hypothetical protein B6U70_01475 [Euryarchaeota archaeon ex4484_162]